MPLAIPALVMTGDAAVIENVTTLVPAVGFAFDALTVTLNVPAAVGVPVICPVLVLSVNPPGRPGAVNDVGELLAVIV